MLGKCPGKRNIIASEVLTVIFSLYLKLNFFAILSAENILLQTIPKAKAGRAAWGPLGYHLVSQPTSRMPVSPASQSGQTAGLMATVLHQVPHSPLQLGGGLKWRVHDPPPCSEAEYAPHMYWGEDSDVWWEVGHDDLRDPFKVEILWLGSILNLWTVEGNWNSAALWVTPPQPSNHGGLF